MLRKWTKATLLVSLILICLIIIKATLSFNQEKNTTTNPVEYLGGYGLTVHDSSNQIYQSFVLDVESKKNFDYILKFSNRTGKRNSFILKVYLDYSEIPFTVTNSLSNKYEFTANDREDIFLPISFPLQDVSLNSHVILFSVISGQDKHARNLDILADSYGINGRYNLRRLKTNNTKNIFKEDTDYSVFKSREFQGILINEDFSTLETFKLPPKLITKRPGEKFEMALRAGGLPLNEYVAWVTIDWDQQPAFNLQPFSYFRLAANDYAYRKIVLEAPKQAGDYEITAFLAPNPWKQLDDGNPQDNSIYTSYRFTLHVE